MTSAALVAGQEVAVIDLVSPARPAPVTAAAGGTTEIHDYRSVIALHGPPQQRAGWPLRLDLVKVQSDPYDARLALVEIRLTALRDTMVPRSEDERAIDPDGRHGAPGFKHMLVGLKISTPAKAVISMSPRGLFGSARVPDSLVSLSQGQSVLVRARIDLSEVDRTRTSAGLNATGLLYTFEGTEAKPNIESGNAIEIPRSAP